MTLHEPIEFDPATTAVVLVDLQHGVVKGMSNGEFGPHSAATAIAHARLVASALRARGGLVVVVRGSMGLSGVPFPTPRTDAGMQASGAVPTDWADVVPELAEFADHVVTKHQWGSFYGTDLEPRLRRNGITTVLLGGIATDLGVESAAREAYDRGFEPVVIEDAATSFDAVAHRHSLTRVVPLIGRVRTTDQVLKALNPAN